MFADIAVTVAIVDVSVAEDGAVSVVAGVALIVPFHCWRWLLAERVVAKGYLGLGRGLVKRGEGGDKKE